MARFLEVRDPAQAPSPLRISVGDVILFRATGGRLAEGDAVEILGPFLPAVFGPDGEVVAPMGTPGSLLAVGKAPGPATIEVFAGGPSRPPTKMMLTIDVSA